MNVTYTALTDIGRVRSINEDAFLVEPELNLFVVADGMGGHAAGDVASKLALKSLVRSYRAQLVALKKAAKQRTADHVLRRAINTANRKVFNQSNAKSHLNGMGTTIVGILLQDSTAFIFHVGDSRAYLIRQDEIELLTSDHSWVNMQVKQGKLNEEDARHHPLKNVITKALGIHKKVEPDIEMRSIKSGDIILLCSDGINNMLEDNEILGIIIDSSGLDAAAGRLIETANNRGGDDNSTVLLVKVHDSG